jgi:hypothetical protein
MQGLEGMNKSLKYFYHHNRLFFRRLNFTNERLLKSPKIKF